MRKILRIGILILLVAAGCSDDDGTTVVGGTRMVLGSGVVAEETRTVSGFSAVTFATEGSLSVVQGQQASLRVRAEDNLLQYLISEVQAGALILRTENGIDIAPTRSIEFDLTVVDLDNVVFSGVGNVDISTMNVDHLSLTSTGVGGVECMNLDALDLDVVLTGVGDVDVAGAVDSQVVTLTGIGEYDAGGLTSREARLTVGSLTRATVQVSDLLVVNFTAGGSVDYIGDPQLQVTGNGTVRKIG